MIRSAGTRGAARRAAFALVGVLGLGSCSSSESVAVFQPITDPAQLFASLTLDHHAINLSLDRSPTLQVTATPHDATGAPMAGLPAPTFRSSDTTAVQVSTDGLLTARRGGVTGVQVIAEIVAPGNVRRVDTAHVNVASTEPAPIASFSIDGGIDGDVFARWPQSQLTQLIINYFALGLFDPPAVKSHALDATGAEIAGVAVEYVSLDSAVAVVDRWNGDISTGLRRPGSVRIMAQTTAYGVTHTAIHTFTVTLPSTADVFLLKEPNGTVVTSNGNAAASEYRIAPNGYIGWTSLLSDTVDLKFEDPTNVAAVPADVCSAINSFLPVPCGEGGDILLPPVSTSDCDILAAVGQGCALGSMQLRQFPVPGVYHFSSVRTGVTGQIVVSDEAHGATGP